MNPSTTLFASSDGSLSAFNNEFGECYSSLSEGALSEKVAKHIAPTFEYLRLQMQGDSQAKIPCNTQSDIWILDICFGLGYNSFLSASAFEYLLEQASQPNKPAKKLHIISLEKDRATLDLARQIWHLDKKKWQSLARGQTSNLTQHTSLTIIWGDASSTLANLAQSLATQNVQTHKISPQIPPTTPQQTSPQTLSKTPPKILQDFSLKDFSQDVTQDFKGNFAEDFISDVTQDFAGFDIIYQDPFSFDKNPALWSEEHFKQLFAISKSDCLITSYATRKEVLANAQKAGFLAYKLKGDFAHQAILSYLKRNHTSDISSKTKPRESSLFSKQEIRLPKSLHKALVQNPNNPKPAINHKETV